MTSDLTTIPIIVTSDLTITAIIVTSDLTITAIIVTSDLTITAVAAIIVTQRNTIKVDPYVFDSSLYCISKLERNH